jgi:hypothetical protein
MYDLFLNSIKNEFVPEKIMKAKVNALIMLWGRKYVPLNIREGLKNEVMKSPEVEHKDIILKILDLVDNYILVDSKDVKKQTELAITFHELSNEMNGIKVIKSENVEDSSFRHRETKQEKKLRDDAEDLLKEQLKNEKEQQEKETSETKDREIENTDDEVEENTKDSEENDEKGSIVDDIVADSGLPAGSLTVDGEKNKESSDEADEDGEEQEDSEESYDEDGEGGEVGGLIEDNANSESPSEISVGKGEAPKDNTSTDDMGAVIGEAMVVEKEQIEREVKMDVRRILETTPPPFNLSYLDIQMAKMLRKKLEMLTAGLQEETAYGQRSGRVHLKSAKTAEITHSSRIFKKKLPDESNKARMAVSILVDGSGSMGSVTANKSKMNVAVRTCFVIANELERMGNFVEVRGFGDDDVQVKAFGQKHADWGDTNWSRTGAGNSDTHTSVIAARENLNEISRKEDFQTKVLMLFGDGAWADTNKVSKEIIKCNKDGIVTVFMKYDEGRNTYKLQDWEMMSCRLGEFIPVKKIDECLVTAVQRIISEVEKEVVKVIMQCRA